MPIFSSDTAFGTEGLNYIEDMPRKLTPTNCLATRYPNLASEWHPTRNGGLTPNDVPYGSNKKFWWACPSGQEDHDYETKLNSRTNMGSGCPACAGRKVVKSNCLSTTHPGIANRWHATKNGLLTPEDVTIGSNRKCWWQCPMGTDHEYEAVVVNQLRGAGCPVCAGKKVVPSNCLSATHPEIAAQWHASKNGALKPIHVHQGMHRKCWWQCPNAVAHEYQASIEHRSRLRSGCPICRESKGEKKIAETLEALDIYHKRQFVFTNCRNVRGLPFDFLILPDGSDAGVIEYQGQQHYVAVERFGGEHELLQVQIRDQIKRDFCREKSLRLLEIPYHQYNDIPALVRDFATSLPARRKFA